MNNITIEEVKDILKCSIDETTNMNEAIERTLQHIYLKGWNDGEKMNEQMDFPNTFDEFAEDYSFTDKEEIYTNGIKLIPVYRVKQWLEHINKPTQMIDKSNFDEKQYKADTDTAYECGRASVLSVINDIKAKIEAEKESMIQHNGTSDLGLALEIINNHIGKEKP